jgi:hypothetical protein
LEINQAFVSLFIEEVKNMSKWKIIIDFGL